MRILKQVLAAERQRKADAAAILDHLADDHADVHRATLQNDRVLALPAPQLALLDRIETGEDLATLHLPPAQPSDGKKEKKKGGKKGDESLLSTAATTPAGASTPVGSAENGERKEKEKEEKPFELVDVKLKIPRGSFVAIVGRVGSGKVRRSCYLLCLRRDRALHRRAPCFKHSLGR